MHCKVKLGYFAALHFAAPKMNVVILPEQTLLVTWEPHSDATRSPLMYNINATVKIGMVETVSKFVPHPTSMTNFTDLPQFSAGTVFLQASNPGALSEVASANYRMVNITGEGDYA